MDLNWGLDLGFPDAALAIGTMGFPMFLQRVGQELTIAGLLKYPYTLVAMAIDEGKELDRRMGMGFGGIFLGELGQALAATIRSQPTEIRSEVDVVARYEDLFLFSFPNTDFNEASVPMRRVIELARREAAKALADPEFTIAISCGILTWEPASGPIAPAAFVYRTIEALYEAKKDAPNKLNLFRLGLKDANPETLRIKHNQTAPLRLRKSQSVTKLITAGAEAAAAAAPPPREAPAGEAPRKKRKKGGKKKKGKGFTWKFW